MIKFIFKSIVILFLFWIAFGFDVPSYEWYVTDQVGVFSDEQKVDLNTKIQEIEQATNIEIAVLIVPTVDDDINLAAVDVGNARWVGKEGQDNGLVVLIAVDDRKWSIQVWYGLEWTLPDLITKRVGEARFPSNFRAWNYYQGVLEMLDDVLWYIKQDPTIMENYSQDTTTNTSSSDDNIGFMFIVIFFAISVFGRWVTVPSTKKSTWRKMKKYGRWMYAGVWLLLSLLITWVLGTFIISAVVSYLFLLFSVLMALAGKVWTSGGMRFWWSWSGGSWWSWGSSFGWFGGGSFGWWWSSGSR